MEDIEVDHYTSHPDILFSDHMPVSSLFRIAVSSCIVILTYFFRSQKHCVFHKVFVNFLPKALPVCFNNIIMSKHFDIFIFIMMKLLTSLINFHLKKKQICLMGFYTQHLDNREECILPCFFFLCKHFY